MNVEKPDNPKSNKIRCKSRSQSNGLKPINSQLSPYQNHPTTPSKLRGLAVCVKQVSGIKTHYDILMQ